jgi:hypothetical protein
MKKLLVLLFSLFFLSSPSVFADDISDFSIEGISLGDSLLDYMTEEEILKEIETNKDYYLNLKEPYKYAEVYSFKDFQSYGSLAFLIKNNSTSKYITNKSNKYTILSIRGLIGFTEDFNGCIEKRDEIAKDLSKVFPNAKKSESDFVDSYDNTIIDGVYFKFDSGAESKVVCHDYEETVRIKNNWVDNLSVAIQYEEIINWLKDD